MLARACAIVGVLAGTPFLPTLFVFGTVEAQGNDLFVGVEPAVAERFADSPDIPDAPGTRTLRRRLVRIDTDLLTLARTSAPATGAGLIARAGRDAPVLTLTLFDDVRLSGIVERAGPTASGLGYVLSGRLRRVGGDDDTAMWDMTLLVYDAVVAGTIRTPGDIYDIRSVGSGAHAISQIEPTLPPDDEPLQPPEPPSGGAGSRVPGADPPTAALDDGSVIDVAVFYTDLVQSGAPGLSSVSNVTQLVDRMFADTNNALRDSGVSLRMNLAHLGPVGYRETTDTSTNLRRLQNDSDGHMDEVHSIRDANDADLVHLLVDLTQGGGGYVPSCGIAWVSNERSTGAYGFALTQYYCLSNYTFAHELGHNLGLHHDRYQTIQARRTTYQYSHGYVNQRAFSGASDDARWRTIMSYDLQCDDAGFRSIAGVGYACRPLRRFSNPDQLYRGDPLGVSFDHPSSGVDGPADARRRIGDLQRTVANFRQRRGGSGSPDLVVQSATVSDATLAPGQSFTLSTTVRNSGRGTSAATTLDYSYRARGSSNLFISVGSDSVGALSPSGTSPESISLTAPTQSGAYEYVACVVPVSGESDTNNNCSPIVSVDVSSGGGGSCTNDLGLVTSRVARSGSWDGSCLTVHYSLGEHARYYSFRLDRTASVRIDLTSPSVDTWLALRNGAGTGTGLIESDNDDGAGTNARITRALTPGTYTIEATTFRGGVTGPFTLTLDVVGSGGVGCTNDLGPVSGTVTRTGSWDGNCDSTHYTSGRYARYYSFRLSRSASVTIDLMSSVDTFLALRNGSGTGTGLIEEDDDGGSGVNSRITRTLSAGTYTIEATTYAARRTGSFTLMLAVGAGGAGPDLVVESPGVTDATLTAGESFTFSATVRNQGAEVSAPTTLSYRQRRAGGSWTVVGTDAVSALSPSGSSGESIGLSAPAQGGTYEYGACVSTVTGESDTGNNCSATVQVVVQEPPDLVVETPTVSEGSLISGESFTLSVRVRNQGGSASAAATLTFRRRRTGRAWTPAGTASIRALSPSGVSSESIGLTAPADADTYEYGACVSTVTGESDTGNNCSATVQVVVQEPPDLVVETPTVSDSSLTSGQSFTLSARVRNQGGSESESATLTYRRRRPDGAWTTEGTDSVGRLSASGTSQESIRLTAPTQAGAYEYGACVSTVTWESETANNCSDPVQVKVCVVERLGSVTVGRRAAGSWDSGCESTNRPFSYARYYSFVVTRTVEVGISLASSRDTYLYLLAGSGTDGRVVASNDDIGGDEVNSRIVRTLSAGTYTIEATTFADGVTGAFTLRVSELRPFADDPVVAGQPIEAEHITELRERIDELRISAGLGRYSWVDRTIRPGVTPVRAVHWEQMRTALAQVYDADGRRRPSYTDEIEVGVPIEADHVNELRRAVEAL